MSAFVPEVFRTSRLLDFSSQRELTAQIGHEPGRWPAVVVKELCDNALDAAEQAGVAPRLRVSVTASMIEVLDNGPGLDGAVVDDILDFNVRVSSREAYVGPWRGAQGNALKTLLAMPFALDGKAGLVEIRSRGTRHSIRIAIDPIAQRPKIEIDRRPSLVKSGTAVRVHWPDSASWMPVLAAAFAEIASVVERYALFNPHLRVHCRIEGTRGRVWEPTDLGWKRWQPSHPPVAAWYDLERFERLFCASLNADRKLGRVRLVRDWIGDFRGLSGTGKRKAILADLGLARASLEDLVKGGAPDQDKLGQLLRAMKTTGTAPKPAALGVVGKEHILERLQLGGMGKQSFEYQRLIDDDALSPRITEIAFAVDTETIRERRILCGINSSPAIMGAAAFREVGQCWGRGLGDLIERHAVRRDHPLAFVMHHTGARLEFVDRGKSALSIKGLHGGDVADAVLQVTGKWNRQVEREIRDSRAAAKREEVFAKPARKISQKAAAAECMRHAYLKASTGGTLPVAPRQIMYAARDHIQERSGKQLDDNYFTQGLLIDYIAEHPDETASWDIAWDARGNLIEPHTKTVIPLGTLAVRQYVRQKGWRNRYGAVLFCEKEGFQPLFEAVKLGERHDIAIMSTKGLSVTAARTLIDALIADGVPVYCIRDFDVTGFSIAGTLARDTKRYAWASRGAIDLGLRLADAEAYGLASERVFHRSGQRVLHDPAEIRAKIAGPLRGNGASDAEIAFLETRRVELNAFASGDLVKFIEKKLDEHGVRKVVPDDATLAMEARSVARTVVIGRILDEMDEEIQKRVAKIATDELRPEMEERLAAERELSWNQVLHGIVRRRAAESDGQKAA